VEADKFFLKGYPMQLRRTEIIVLANQKGGCGKSTAAVSLGAGFARAGYSVCVVDVDPQCNATDTFGISRDELSKSGMYTVADAYLAKNASSLPLLENGQYFPRIIGILVLSCSHYIINL